MEKRKSLLNLPKGIVKANRGTKYCARLVIKHSIKGSITHYIGSYETIDEAVEARKNYILNLL